MGWLPGRRTPSTGDCFDRDENRDVGLADKESSACVRGVLRKSRDRERATEHQTLDCLYQTTRRPIPMCKCDRAAIRSSPATPSILNGVRSNSVRWYREIIQYKYDYVTLRGSLGSRTVRVGFTKEIPGLVRTLVGSRLLSRETLSHVLG